MAFIDDQLTYSIRLQLGHLTGSGDVRACCTTLVGRVMRQPWQLPLSTLTTASPWRVERRVSYRLRWAGAY